MKKILLSLIFIGCALTIVTAQKEVGTKKVNGHIVKVMISDDGDTFLLANLKDVSVSTIQFDNQIEKGHYDNQRKYAIDVFPYGVKAIQLFREIEAATNDMKRRNKKKHIKDLHRRLKKEFEEPLRSLSTNQGKVLIKMIERELGVPCYDVVKELKGGFTAMYWNQFSKLFDYDLTSGYDPERDPILEQILSDLDVSYDLTNEFNQGLLGQE